MKASDAFAQWWAGNEKGFRELGFSRELAQSIFTAGRLSTADAPLDGFWKDARTAGKQSEIVDKLERADVLLGDMKRPPHVANVARVRIQECLELIKGGQ